MRNIPGTNGFARANDITDLTRSFANIATTIPTGPACNNHRHRLSVEPTRSASPVLSLPTVPTHVPTEAPRRRPRDPVFREDVLSEAAKYTQPFCKFLSENPTVYHAVETLTSDLRAAGFKPLSEREEWNLEAGGKYYFERNGSSAIAFSIGENYKPGNGVAMLAGHVDALTLKVKPIPTLKPTAGYLQLGVAPYAGALNSTWWDRDLGLGGRVVIKDHKTGKVESKLFKLDYPIARIPTLAPHFGAISAGPFNPETQMVPIIGLEDEEEGTINLKDGLNHFEHTTLAGDKTFASTQPKRLVAAVAKELGISDYSSILSWDLEMYDTQPAQTGGLSHEFIFGGRIDDKICSWAAVQALINVATSKPFPTPTPSFFASSTNSDAPSSSASSIIQLVGLYDDEEIGSLLRQGARSNLLPSTIERILDSLSHGKLTSNTLQRTYANSYLISSDVTHAVNPNFLSAYLPNHAPKLNVGIAIAADSNGHMTTDALSTALLTECAARRGQKLQVFQIRNDVRSGGTVGPMLSSMTGVRSIDAGIPQLSMHSIRATVGALDPGLGVGLFQGFLEEFEDVDRGYTGIS